MGIAAEYNPDLALRNYSEFLNKKRAQEECIPSLLVKGKTYSFLKKGQRHYWLLGEIPLIETKGDGKLSRPHASVIILEETHFVKDNEVYTKGTYKVIDVYAPTDTTIYFEGFLKRKS